MANHCWNYVVFHGNPEGAKKLHNKLTYLKNLELKEKYIDEGKEIPSYENDQTVSLYALLYPKIFQQKWKEDQDVYDKFGSRWFECSWQLESDGSINLSGDSAWSPVLLLFEKICKHFKMKAWGNYEEPGLDFAGEFEIEERGITVHDQVTYRQYQAVNNPNSFWEDAINSIEDGHFETLENIFADFESCNWTLSDKERKQIEEEWKKYQESQKDEVN